MFFSKRYNRKRDFNIFKFLTIYADMEKEENLNQETEATDFSEEENKAEKQVEEKQIKSK